MITIAEKVEGFTLHKATIEDIPTLKTHRRRMFEDMGGHTPEQLDRMDAEFVPWMAEKFRQGSYFSWLAVKDHDTGNGVIAAGADVWLMDWPPGPFDATMRRAYILNVYTAPDFRRRGLARWLVGTILDWCASQGIITVSLHASNQGQPVYESLGFHATNEMRILFT